MSNKRTGMTSNRDMILYDQVDGICPLCLKPLYYTKEKNIQKRYEVAHIYPLNPTEEEIELLKEEEKLSDDVNSLDNLIPLCLNCHEQFDKPRSVKEYRNLLKIKKRIIEESKIKNTYYLYDLEDEIRIVIKELESTDLNFDELKTLEYRVLKIEDKANKTLPNILKRQIENDVRDYFIFIQDLFKQIDKDNVCKFDTLAMQVKGFYYKCMQTTQDQAEIFDSVVNWINKKTGNHSKKACEILVSFFIQDCEVFS